MPVIKHEGRNYVLKTIRLKCLKCGTFCETSKPYPDMEHCDCGLVVVDGGISMGATINGNPWAMEDYSIYRTEDKPKIELPQEIVTAKHQQLRENMIIQYRRHGLTEEQLDEIKSGR
jgi:hypothetical protein